jgi:hypothetical protein
MNWQRLAVIFTVLNLVMLMLNLAEVRSVAAQRVPDVLWRRALEIVDDHGRVRAEIKVLPAQPTLTLFDGTVGYPETVQLRLLDSKNGPHVKLPQQKMDRGWYSVAKGAILSCRRGAGIPIKIVTADGREQTIKP